MHLTLHKFDDYDDYDDDDDDDNNDDDDAKHWQAQGVPLKSTLKIPTLQWPATYRKI